VIIDPGTADCFDLLDFLKSKNLTPDFIMLTHEHFDHIWGVNTLLQTFGCKLIASTDCSEKIMNKRRNLSLFYDQIGFETPNANIIIKEGNTILTWNNNIIECIESKGHSSGSICILSDNKLFTGDTIIKDYKTVVKLPGGNKSELKVTLEKIFLMFNKKKIIVFPGHEECFNLDEVDITNFI
jgi:glyoxylase-like metal-dependent hydrolase (beta-lactamase superfamily II)